MTAETTPAGSGAPRGRHRRSKGDGPKPYDFRRPTKLSREHVRSLQVAFETFARQWSTLLTSSLRVVTQVTNVSIEQVTYAEYVQTLSNPTVMALATIEPLDGQAVLEMPLATAMTSVDHLLGGPGTGDQPNRPLSDIETALLRGLIDRTVLELRYAFDALVRFDPQVQGLEYNPQFAQAASASDMVIVATFELDLGAEGSLATVCLPFASLMPHLEAATGHGVLSDRERAAREAAGRHLADRLESVPVEVTVRFEPARLTPSTLVALQVGDVLPLPHPVAAPLAVTAADVTFASAVPGAQGKRLACLVVDQPVAPPPAVAARGAAAPRPAPRTTARRPSQPAGASRA
ncbi:flagellar motor switch protein FliM [Vallicoccus soli]|uniref:Flagellar motor switch protein FliM n=1 Tax=Vallicoccus soli TaxID=2339232 RepID=A0A3A3YUR3_9ACTN|nr:flagellar motor switch protein FliM [Vallicoccus soli]RJK92806.1 flagellar motor switch protein FliM [Vallicoccus soli]